ncbi:proteasome assembly chaperone 2 [Biomphalaria glabrata]|nr:proteasome assembly chaperone 2-like [Biomphalaria glabrata]
MFIKEPDKSSNFVNCTLILPCVSVGNVGQLAADLLISNFSFERVGYIVHPSLLPCIGNNPYAVAGDTLSHMTTCCEVYQNTDAKLVIMQQRAPFVKNKGKEFASWLVSWIKESHFAQVIVLTSSFAQERIDQQLSGPPFRILLTNEMDKKFGDELKNQLSWKELERRHSLPTPSPLQICENGTGSQVLYMPGSGIAKQIFEKCQDLPVLVLLMFVSEGDNAGDAVAMADQLNKWLKLKWPQNVDTGSGTRNPTTWSIPSSWRLVFGSTFDPILFQ